MSTDAPPCPACAYPLGTPVRYPWGECIPSNGTSGPSESTLWCPACGHGWVGTPEELAAANQSLREYDESCGYPWKDEPKEETTEETQPTRLVDPRQLHLFPGSET